MTSLVFRPMSSLGQLIMFSSCEQHKNLCKLPDNIYDTKKHDSQKMLLMELPSPQSKQHERGISLGM